MDTTIEDIPWQAMILLRDSFNCGGTLVGRKHVITAAHCVFNRMMRYMYAIEELTVVLGITNKYMEPGLRSKIDKIIRHPDYNTETHENDIAVLVLKENIAFCEYDNIRPACLPNYKSSTLGDFVNQTATISGWGRTRKTDNQTILQKAEILVMGNSCEYSQPVLKPGMFCAGDLTSKDEKNNHNKDTCKGDSGGPLTVPDKNNNNAVTLIGVTSWGAGCGRIWTPTFYVDVIYYQKNGWLTSQLIGLDTRPPPPGPTVPMKTTSTKTTSALRKTTSTKTTSALRKTTSIEATSTETTSTITTSTITTSIKSTSIETTATETTPTKITLTETTSAATISTETVSRKKAISNLQQVIDQETRLNVAKWLRFNSQIFRS